MSISGKIRVWRYSLMVRTAGSHPANSGSNPDSVTEFWYNSLVNDVKTLQVITDITDASYNEMYGVMRGIAKSLSNDEVVIAPVTPVQEFSITQGAFLTRLLAKTYFTPAVIFTNVCPHPTYKSDVIGKIKGKDIVFMGGNNGVFDWLARDFGLEYLLQITVRKPYVVDGNLIYLPGENPPADYDSRFQNKTDFLTFGAHTILGSIAVALSLGIDYKNFGEEISVDSIIPLEISDGEIVHIDNYGNAKIYGSFDFSPGTKLELNVKNNKIADVEYINDRMMSHPTGSFVVYPSTSLPNMVDMALVRGNGCNQLKLQIGDILNFRPLN